MLIYISIFSIIFNLSANNPEELGKVNWIRNYDQALLLSEEKQKPIFILFQEVPGCSTCKNYGNNILRHPFIVEAIEDNFIPLVIYNNKGGKDKEVLDLYDEPTWNNPVVRIVNSKGKNIVDRLSGNYTMNGLTSTIMDGMLKSNNIIPDYLHLLAEEVSANEGQLNESYVSMYCFWTGEKVIGNIKGVVETEAGFMDGKEVVRFKYNPDQVAYKDIIKKAKQEKCADMVYTNDSKEQSIAHKLTQKSSKEIKAYRADKESKYYLKKSDYRYLPMTQLQINRVNSALGSGYNASVYLSPRQLILLEYIKEHKKIKPTNITESNFQKEWWKMYDKFNMSS